jgi:hypothetical protein
MVEELDTPGEYILNETTGLLSTIFPTECTVDDKLVCPTRVVPHWHMTEYECCMPGNCSLSGVVRVNGATNITFRGVNISGSTGVGVSVLGSSNITFDACQINNHQEGLLVGSAAITSTEHPCGDGSEAPIDSSGISLLRSDIGYTGRTGSSFAGGNRTTLAPSRILVENNRFHDFSLETYTYTPGVVANGVGVTVRKNEFRSTYSRRKFAFLGVVSGRFRIYYWH